MLDRVLHLDQLGMQLRHFRFILCPLELRLAVRRRAFASVRFLAIGFLFAHLVPPSVEGLALSIFFGAPSPPASPSPRRSAACDWPAFCCRDVWDRCWRVAISRRQRRATRIEKAKQLWHLRPRKVRTPRPLHNSGCDSAAYPTSLARRRPYSRSVIDPDFFS